MARLNILHISDLHFGLIEEKNGRKIESRSTHFFVDAEDRPDPNQLAQLLVEEYSEGPPDVVVASGDIGWSGNKADYKPALVFFRLLREQWPLTAFVIVPGNHDVNQRKGDNNDDRQSSFTAFLQAFYNRGKPKASEFDWVHPMSANAGRDNLVSIQTLPVSRNAGAGEPGAGDGKLSPILGVVVGMNSAAGLNVDSVPVRIDPTALSEVDRRLKKLDLPEDALKILVIHHHLFPFAEASWGLTSDTRRASERKADPDLVANSAKLQSWLTQRQFHIVLHGHKHTSHGREDLLRRDGDEANQRLLIVGAGSTGVRRKSRAHGEPLTFNKLTCTRFSRQRWQIRVVVQKILEAFVTPETRTLYEYTSIAGVDPRDELTLPLFRAERMDDCHRAIESETKDGILLYNFLSIVEDASYRHPPTARNGKEHPEIGMIEHGFKTLHPEYKPTKRWRDLANIDQPLRQAQLSYRFEHGSRLFQSPDNRLRRSAEEVARTSPLMRVIEQLQRDPSTSKAYVSLYRSEIDVLSAGEQPLPGLMGLQFITRESAIDLTATFRKIELSFWWCLNMYELGKLLSWVCEKVGKPEGRLTFFASLAEWKQHPEPPVEAELDSLPIAELLPLVLDVANNKEKLAQLLGEKAKLISENSLDHSGLGKLGQLLKGATSKETADGLLKALRDKVLEANDSVTEAKNAGPHGRERHTQAGVTALKAAIRLLDYKQTET